MACYYLTRWLLTLKQGGKVVVVTMGIASLNLTPGQKFSTYIATYQWLATTGMLAHTCIH